MATTQHEVTCISGDGKSFIVVVQGAASVEAAIHDAQTALDKFDLKAVSVTAEKVG